ncbi:MAG TPA: iduronate sulfatase [Phycisphaerales bacterium]|nr:iduronate sulfatase [Phycisphaerales bacterium]
MNLSRRDFIGTAAACAAGLAIPRSLWANETPRTGPRKNVLFFPVDDLRPELGCYGHPIARSPNIDRLARAGLLFERAYCQQAVCGPTRASLLTGLRPDTTRVYDLKTHIRTTLPDVVTLPQHFKNHGYHSEAIGKVFHSGLEDEASYSVPHRAPPGPSYCSRENLDFIARKKAEGQARGLQGDKLQRYARGPAWEAADVPDNAYRDGKLADMAIEALRRLAPAATAKNPADRKPFFLSVGFAKPHLPFCAPKRYWDLYDRAKIPIPIQDKPKDAPPIAFADWGELRSYTDIPDVGNLNEDQTRELIHGYYACVSYTDAQIGRLLDELDRLGLTDNTVIVLWGDHGWKLGEYATWCKHTNFELDTHVPMIFVDPAHPGGRRTRALTEFVDIYPTLAELCGLPAPARTEGVSMVPLFEDPDRKWKSAAFSQYPRPGASLGHDGRIMGYSMRTDRYRYTEWQIPGTGEVKARELYDLDKDPLSTVNLAENPAQAQTVADLHEKMKAGWRAARP